MLRRFSTGVLGVVSLVGLLAVAGPADARGSRHAAMMLDANTGAVFHNDGGDELRHPASLTKMMTLYLTFETIESGRMSMSDRVVISQEAANVAPSKLELDPGEDIAVSDAIRALITKSANDVAVALAEKIGGTQANFVKLMNARARDLGMTKTHFENASGLPDNDQVTTARDMITLGMRLQDDFPTYYPMFAMRVFSYKGSSHRNHNTMLNNFAGIDGIKTGYTSKSGFNLVSSVRRGSKHIIGAVFGGASAATRNGEMRMLLTRALTRASTVKTRKPPPSLIAKLRLKSEPKLAQRPVKPKPPVQVAKADVPPAPERAAVRATVQSQAPAPAPVQAAKAILMPSTEPTPDAVIAEAETVPEAGADTPAQSESLNPPTAPVSAALPPAPIEVFKVKKVMVTARKAAPEETTDMGPDESDQGETTATSAPASERVALAALAAGDQLSIDSLVAAHEAAARQDSGLETVIAKTTPGTKPAPPAPAFDKSQMTMLGARDAVPPPELPSPVAEVVRQAPAAIVAPAAVAVTPASKEPPAPAPQAAAAPPVRKVAAPAAKPAVIKVATGSNPAPIQRGQQPSTLQAQAASLEPSSAVRQTAALSPSTGRYEIQIGAYDTVQEAQRNLDAVQSKADKVLSGHPSVTQPVQKAGRPIYRARFRGFDAQSAASTCSTLRTQSIDCFVMTTE